MVTFVTKQRMWLTKSLRFRGIWSHGSTLSTSAAPDEKSLKSFDEIPGPKFSQFMWDQFKITAKKEPKKTQGHFMMNIFEDMWKEYGDICKLEAPVPLKEPFVCLFNPEMIEKVMRASGARPNRPGFVALGIKRDMDVKSGQSKYRGLVTSQGEEWYQFRKRVQQPMLKPSATRRYTPLLEEIALTFIDNLVRPRRNSKTNETPEDFLLDLYKWALESVSLIALETNLGCLDKHLPEGSEQLQMIQSVQNVLNKTQDLESGTNAFMLYPNMSMTFRSFARDCDLFTQISKKHVLESMSRLKNNKSDQDDPSLLEMFFKNGCDEEQAALMASDMMFAGVDTSAHATAFAFYQLAKHPEVQEKLHKEISAYLPSVNSKLEHSMLEKMTYLSAVLKETQRLNNSVIGTLRKLDEPIELGGYLIDKKCWLFGGHLYMARSEKFFDDPMEFRPERWLRGHTLREDVHPFTNLPFGHGPRMCIGRRFAEQEVKILICKMIQNFKIEWHQEDLNMVLYTLVRPDGPVKLTLIDR